MKKLIITLLLLVTTISYSQEITETERIIDKYSSQIYQNLTELVKVSEPYVKETFEVVVRLKIAEGIVYLLMPFFTIISWFLFNMFYNKMKKSDDYHDWIDNTFGIHTTVFLILSILGTLASIPCLYNGITHLLAPEWYAIKELSNLIN